MSATAVSLPSPFFSLCGYYCMPVQALRPDIRLPLSKSSPSLTNPNPSWVNPSRAGGTSAGSALDRAVQACIPARNPPLAPVLCQDVSPPCHCHAVSFLWLSTGILLLGPLFLPSTSATELYGLPGQSLSIRMSHCKDGVSCCFPSPPQRQLCLKTKHLLDLTSNWVNQLPFSAFPPWLRKYAVACVAWVRLRDLSM